MIASLFDEPVAVHTARLDEEPPSVFGEESAYLEAMKDSRRREFSHGRAAARSALHRLGVPPGPIPRDAQRVPVWPEGFVGSITHCDGFIAAAVAPTSRVLGLGIDAECIGRVDHELTRSICTPTEEARLMGFNQTAKLDWRTLVFSAKESFYKAWYPSTRTPLGFTEVELMLQPDESTFVITVGSEKAGLAPWGATATGKYVVGERHIVTGVVVPVRSR